MNRHKTATVRVPERIDVGINGTVTSGLDASVYTVRMPADYDPAEVTGEDLCCDPALEILTDRPE